MRREIDIGVLVNDERITTILVDLISKCKDVDFESINLTDYSTRYECIR